MSTKQAILIDLELLKRVIGNDTTFNRHDNYAPCPFHEEKTPSFNIYKNKQGKALYNCFGCGARGDVFNYLKNRHHLSFATAMTRLADVANLPPPAREDIIPFSSLLSTLGVASRSNNGNGGLENLDFSNPRADPFCMRDCLSYHNLNEDCNILVEENQILRDRLKMPGFAPTEPKEYDAILTLRWIERIAAKAMTLANNINPANLADTLSQIDSMILEIRIQADRQARKIPMTDSERHHATVATQKKGT